MIARVNRHRIRNVYDVIVMTRQSQWNRTSLRVNYHRIENFHDIMVRHGTGNSCATVRVNRCTE